METEIMDRLTKIKKSYDSIREEYDKMRLLQERRNVPFYDTSENIFDDSEEHIILMDCIERYKTISNSQYNHAYGRAKAELEELQKDLDSHAKAVIHRQKQIEISKAEKLASEVAFIDSFLNIIKRAIKLIDQCLNPIHELISCISEKPSISHRESEVLLQINKCIILYSTGLFKDECVQILNHTTNKLRDREYYSCELLYKSGELNLQYRLYSNAICLLSLLLKKLDAIPISDYNSAEKNMYFSANMMLVSCYEYSGDYSRALSILIEQQMGTDQVEQSNGIVKIFEDALQQEGKKMNDLVFAFDDKPKQDGIIGLLNNILVKKRLFRGKLATFVYDNGQWYLQEAQKQNSDLSLRIQTLYNEVLLEEGEKQDEERLTSQIQKQVIDRFRIPIGTNKLLHDYLHLLAHCLNEEAVLRIKNTTYELYRKLITLSRALMLLVSQDKDLYEAAWSYQSCFASVYAESGEFNIARNCIVELVGNEEYQQMDAASKAEVDFYYYLFPRIDAISNSEAIQTIKQDNKHYDHYLNCCYRNLDFDAISHMAVISCESKLAEILQLNDLGRISEHFYNYICNNAAIDEYRKAIKIDNYNGHNIWLVNEKKRLKYICHFLSLYLLNNEQKPICDINENSSAQRNSSLIESAYQYLKLNISLGRNADAIDIPFISFSDISQAIKIIRQLFGVQEEEKTPERKKYEIIEAESVCLIINKDTNTAIQFGNSRAFFIYDKASFSTDNKKNHRQGADAKLYFRSSTEAVREFFLYVTFLKIKQDFINPSRIFIMTPVNNAEPCKFYRNDDTGLILEAHDQLVGHEETDFSRIDDQLYYSMLNPLKLSTSWITRLSAATTKCKWAVSFYYGEETSNEIRYTLFYPDKDPISAILYKLGNCKVILSGLYPSSSSSTRPLKNHNEHNQSKKYCVVQAIPKTKEEVYSALMESLPELPWEATNANSYGTLFLWKCSVENVTVWRIVCTEDFEDGEETRHIMQAICNCGVDDALERYNEGENECIKDLSISRWPDPYDVELGEPFVFISHIGSEDLKVKSELKSFFVSNNIRFWYDKDFIVGNWLERVTEIIQKDNCVGCILLITSEKYFLAHGVNKEFQALLARKNDKNRPGFKILPVAYGYKNKKNLCDSIKKIYKRSELSQYYNTLASLIEIDKEEFYYMCLNRDNGTTLKECTQKTVCQGRSGTIIQMCKELKCIREDK